jgi:hypothetical protein
MQQENISETLASAVEKLNSDELATALKLVHAAREILDQACAETNNEDLLMANAALGRAIESGTRARRLQQAAYSWLGLYLLHIENGTPESPPRKKQALALSVRTAQGGGVPQDLEVTVDRVERLPPLMDEDRNIVWVRVKGSIVPLLESVDGRAYRGYADNWERFRAAGLPVPPMFLRGQDGRLLIPELKQDGSEVYGTGLARDLYHRRPRERPRPAIDAMYLRLTDPRHFDAITLQVRRYARLASEQKLQLPFHDPFQLWVRPDGSWELTMRDLRAARDVAQYPHLYTAEELMARNEQSVALWLARMQVLRQYLSGEPIPMNHEYLRALFNPETGRL